MRAVAVHRGLRRRQPRLAREELSPDENADRLEELNIGRLAPPRRGFDPAPRSR